jgi:hypothetical protein
MVTRRLHRFSSPRWRPKDMIVAQAVAVASDDSCALNLAFVDGNSTSPLCKRVKALVLNPSPPSKATATLSLHLPPNRVAPVRAGPRPSASVHVWEWRRHPGSNGLSPRSSSGLPTCRWSHVGGFEPAWRVTGGRVAEWSEEQVNTNLPREGCCRK